MASQEESDSALLSGPVTITFQVGGDPMFIKKRYELLVVACDPRNLYGVCDYKPEERAVFKEFTNFTFHTSLLRVKGRLNSEYGVIFSPEPMDRMDGSIYAFRNETVKTFGFDAANGMSENLVTVYQIHANAWPAEKFEAYLRQQLETINWWPYGRRYGQDYEIVTTFTTPYFDHFSVDDLKKDSNLPWKFMALQGKHNTIYAHASSCFESTLQCWQYANVLMNNVGVKLPVRRDAHIAILGAGASGILFANRLRDLKYTHVEILEVTDRSDGKIDTITMEGPYPPGSKEPTYCELGCCYLSPAYDDFVAYLKPFLKGNERIPLVAAADASRFRGIVTTGQFPGWQSVPYLMPFDKYVLQKAKYELNYPPNYSDLEIEAEMFVFLEGYGALQPLFMGSTVPMPLERPTNFDQSGLKTFRQFLNDSGLRALVGTLQYGYSVQGYGPLDHVSAFYGMIWISPAVTQGMIESGLNGTPVVTAWSKGWGNVWEQMKAGMKIIYNVKTIKITRED